MYEFPVNGPIATNIRIFSGSVNVTAEECDTATVEVVPWDDSAGARDAAAQTRVELKGGTLVVEPQTPTGWLWRRGWKIRVEARVPIDSTLRLKSAAAAVQVNGRWSEANLNSASGNLRVDHVTGSVTAHSASGRIEVNQVGNTLNAKSASGDLTVGTVGNDASLHSASGDISLADAGRSVTARTASGDIEVRRASRGEIRTQTASGDVVVGVAPGTTVRLDLFTASGDTRSDLSVGDTPPVTSKGNDLNIVARSASGDVSVVRAAEAPSYR